jgi:hypothetical protein
MSHDKIRSATRERMTVTGEPYAAARREVMREHKAAGGTRRSELADATVHNPPPGGSMLLWINGPCGVGKTATAFELNRRLPGSVLCDPEHVGYGMRRMLPRPLWRRWQDIPAWRHSVLELLRMTLAGHDGPVIAPGTLVNLEHFQEIIGGLRGDGANGGCVPAALAGSPGPSRGKPRSSTTGSSSSADPSSPSTFTPITGRSRRWPTWSPARRD